MKKRLAGYRDALAEYELPFREELVFEGNIDYKDGIASARKAHGRGTPCHSGGSRGRYSGNRSGKRAFYERGVKVPDGISPLWGLTNLEIAQYMTPGLTTVKQHMSSEGKKRWSC